MRRREFIASLAGTAAWPMVARAQQTAMPVVGFIDMRPAPEDYESFVRGLSEAGLVDHKNVLIDRREAADADQLSAIAGDLVRSNAAVISGPINAIIAARAVTSAIPLVFIGGADPTVAGLVQSFNRPGGNVTGVRLTAGELPAKQLELLHELLPTAKIIGLLINPKFTNAEPDAAVILGAADALGVKVVLHRVTAESDFEETFDRFSQEDIGALLLYGNLFFGSYRDRLAALAIHHNFPMIATTRAYVGAGALMSYGTNTPDVIRQAGLYAGRILKGERPADMPVLQPTKFDFVINLKTAKTLGLTVPEALLLRADEVIE
jgi:putative tryptophan/tyrosine transport system substrate-binding protein